MNEANVLLAAQEFSATNIIMILMGVVLFVILARALMLSLDKDKSVLPLLPFFLVAIVMIGFPVIASFTFNAKDLTLTLDKDIAAVQNNPTDPKAREALKRTLADTTKAAKADANTGAVAAESIARANLQLNNPQSAVEWADLAVKTKPGNAAARNVLLEAQKQQKLMDKR